MTTSLNPTSVYVLKKSELFFSKKNNFEGVDISNNFFDLTHIRHAVIEASAGTGKTFTLVELVIELLLEQEIPLKSILLVTFTEKATTELRTRLRRKIQELLELSENVINHNNKVPKESVWEINSFRKKKLKAALLDFDSAPIYTIHGFCKRILSEFAFENRQLFEQKLCDKNSFFPDIFGRYVRQELLSKDTPVSKLFNLFVKCTEGNLASLEKDIIQLLSKDGEFRPNLPPFDIFYKKFSKLWQVLVLLDLNLRDSDLFCHPIRNAFEKTALNQISSRKTMKNIDSLIKILAASHTGASVLEILPDFLEIELNTLISPRCRNNLKAGEFWLTPKDFPTRELEWINAVSNCMKLLHSHDIQGNSKKILKAWVTQQVLGDLRINLNSAKLEKGVFDFDDLLRVVEEQVIPQKSESSNVSALTKAIRKKYVCAIVDEFQDTDRSQWNIFRHVFLESQEHRLIVIGDPKQAIYSFRGADIFTYLQARKNIQQKSSRVPFTLKKNFRSTKEVLRGLNQIFSGKVWFPKNRGILYNDVGCGNPKLKLKDDMPNRKAIHLLKLLPQFTISGKKIVDQKKSKKPKIPIKILDEIYPLVGNKYFGNDSFLTALQIEIGSEISFENRKELLNLFLDDQSEIAVERFAEEISLEIRSLLRIGSNKKKLLVWKDDNGERSLKENDICVLFRKSRDGDILAKALRRNGIDFSFYKQKGLFNRLEALEILNLLEAIAHPMDHSRIGRLLLTRFFGIKINELAQKYIPDVDFINQLHEWNSLAVSRRFDKLFDQIIKRTKLIERELLIGGDERSVTNYLHLFEFLNRKVKEGYLNLFELIQLIRSFIAGNEDSGENEELLKMESERETVQLMTMHSAKGLEFPIIFLLGGFTDGRKNSAQFYHDKNEKPIIDLINSKIPDEYQWQEDAENQRLLYVAMTRACGRLYLPFVDFLHGNSGKRICKIGNAYSMLNNELSMISEKSFKEKNNSIFSRSTVGTKELNFIEKINPAELKRLKDWKFPELPKVPEITKEIENPKEFFNRLLFKKKGFVLSSFSRMKRKKEEKNKSINILHTKEKESFKIRTDLEWGFIRDDDETVSHHLLDTPELEFGDETQVKSAIYQKYLLPRGVQTGNILHDLLERIDFTLIRESSSWENWFRIPSVSRMIRSINERYGVSPGIETGIAEIIWNSLRTRIRLGDANNSPVLELVEAKKELREAIFFFPIPFNSEKNNSIQGKGISNPIDYYSKVGIEGWTIKKGFLRGSIDFLFEYESKIYILDWKSNFLRNYSQEALSIEVAEKYELQLQIYTIATSYWFKLNSKKKYDQKFGGIIYLFLRGIQSHFTSNGDSLNFSNEGVYFRRPSWRELKAYENKLNREKY